MADPFDNLANRALPSSDVLGEGAFPAPSRPENSFLQAAGGVASQALETSGVSLLRQDVEVDEQKSMSLLDKFFNKPKWFAGSIGIPNPVNAALKGINWYSTSIVDPLVGVGASLFQGNKGIYEDTVAQSRGGLWNKFQSFGDLNRQRGDNRTTLNLGLFDLTISEKFISSMVGDPLTYVGWGFLGKVPLAGKALGPLESQFIRWTNLPFEAGSKIYKKVPGKLGLPEKTRGQAARLAGDQAFETWNQASLAALGKPAKTMTVEDADILMGKVMDLEHNLYGDLPVELQKLRDEVFNRSLYTDAEISRIIDGGNSAIRGTDLDKFDIATLDLENLPIGVRKTISDVMDSATVGRLSNGGLGASEASDYIMATLGLPHSPEFQEGMMTEIGRMVQERHLLVKEATTNLAPDTLRDGLIVKAKEASRVNSEFGFDDWVNRYGFFGGAVNSMDKIQNRAYQQGLRRWFIQPSQKYILSFLGFPMSESVESVSRQWLGRSTHGWMDQNAFSTKYSGHVGFSDLLDDLERPAFNRAGEAITGEVGMKEFFGAVGVDIPQHIFKKLDIAGRSSLDLTNKMSGLARRHYIDYRFLSEAMPVVDESFPEIAKVLKELPQELGQWRDEIQHEIVTRVFQGEDAIIDDIITRYTDEFISPDVFHGASRFKDTPVLGRIIGHYQKKEFRKQADRFIENNNWGQQSGTLVHNWIDRGGSIKELTHDIIPSIREIQKKEFLNSPEASVDSMHIILAAAKNAADGDVAGATNIINYANAALDDLQLSIHRISANSTKAARGQRAGSEAQFAVFDEATKAVDAGLSKMDEVVGELEKELYRLDPTGNQGSLYKQKVDSVIRTVRTDRNEVQAYVKAWGNKTKNDKFFKGLYEIRDRNYSAHLQTMSELNKQTKEALVSFNTVVGNTFPTRVEKEIVPKTFGSMDVNDIAYILGNTSEAVTQAIMSPVFSSKEQFTRMVMDAVEARPSKFLNVTEDKIGRSYDKILKQFGQTDATWSHAAKIDLELDSFLTEMRREAIAPKFNEPQALALEKAVGDAKIAMGNSRAELKEAGTSIMDTVRKDYKRQFIDYDDQTLIDDFMKSIFPFWTYEARRPGFLLRQMVQKPGLASQFGPDGRYWEATGDGYVNSNIGGFDVNPLAGGVFGSLRRTWKSEYPNAGTQGLQGSYDRAEEGLARMGFYAGSHIQLFTRGVLPFLTGKEAELGEAAPTPFSAGLGALEAVGFTPASALRKTVFRDRFHQYTVSRILWDNGFSPEEMDFETWEPKPGAKTLTQDAIAAALRKAGAVQFVTEQAGVVRYRTDAEREYRQTKDGVLSQFTGLSQEDIDEARRQGRSPLAGVALSPEQRRFLNELPGNEEWIASVNRVQEGEKRKREDHTADMWSTYKTQVEVLTAEQELDDEKLLTGQIAPLTWRENRQMRGQEQSNILPSLRGIKYIEGETIITDPNAPFANVPVTEEEYLAQARELGIDTIKAQHPVDEYMETYNSIQPKDLDGDDIPEWDAYFQRRKAYLENEVDPAWLPLVEAEIRKNDTHVERELRRLSDGILGQYWDINRVVEEEFGVGDLLKQIQVEQSVGDTYTADLLKRDPRYRQFTKEVRRRRQLLRRDNADLDYALNIFGFTGKSRSFQNPEAEAFWNANGASLGFFQ